MALTAPLTYANALTELKTLTSQTGNFTFTDDELTQAIEQAWNDTYVVKPVWDSSLTYTPGTWQYAIPTGVTVVKDIYFKRASDNYPELISHDLYEIVNGNIQFNEQMYNWLYDIYSLYIKGSYKLTTSDSLDSNNLVNYVIYLAAELLLTRLLLKKTFVFLTNDTTVQETSAALQAIQSQTLRYKQALAREWESL